MPFGSTGYQPLWVGLGQLGLYLSLPLTFSFYVRKQIGCRAWRLIHYGSFTLFMLIFLHGAGRGTDSTNPFISAMYYLTGGSVLFRPSTASWKHSAVAGPIRLDRHSLYKAYTAHD